MTLRTLPVPPPLSLAADRVLLAVLARPWLALWLRLYPAARPAVLWALHEELATAPPHRRWGRSLGFLMRLPQFAAAQAEAERSPSTRTGGQPPESSPPGPSSVHQLRQPALFVVRWVAVLIFAVLSVLMWLGAVGEMFDLVDRPAAVRVSEVLALGTMIAVATVPVALLLTRRRFAWLPQSIAGRSEHRPVRIACIAALVIFTILALIAWGTVMGEYFTRLDENSSQALGETFAMALIPLIAVVPLVYVVAQRHWLPRRNS